MISTARRRKQTTKGENPQFFHRKRCMASKPSDISASFKSESKSAIPDLPSVGFSEIPLDPTEQSDSAAQLEEELWGADIPNWEQTYQQLQEDSAAATSVCQALKPVFAQAAAKARLKHAAACKGPTMADSPDQNMTDVPTPPVTTSTSSDAIMQDVNSAPASVTQNSPQTSAIITPVALGADVLNQFGDDEEITTSRFHLQVAPGKFDLVADTKKNRQLLLANQTAATGIVTSVEEHDDKFKALALSDQTAANAAAERNKQLQQSGKRKRQGDDTYVNPKDITAAEDASAGKIRKITLGHCVMNVNQLSLKWREGEEQQRPVVQENVRQLLDNMRISIKRTDPVDRIYVSMTKTDLQKSCNVTDGVLAGLDSTSFDVEGLDAPGAEAKSWNLITRQDHHYETFQDLPKLVLARDGSFPGRPITARVEAGQHRVKALADLALELLTAGEEFDWRCIAEDSERGERALKLYGFGVTILDADEMVKEENQQALAAVRRNAVHIALADSPGNNVFQALRAWKKLKPEELEEYSSVGGFKLFCNRHLRASSDESARLKRVFLTPQLREALYALVSTTWGQELFTQGAFSSLASVRSRSFIAEQLLNAKTHVKELLDPSLWATTPINVPTRLLDLPVNGVKDISLAEIEALASCFSDTTGKLHHGRLLQLFFPQAEDEDSYVFKMLPEIKSYDREVFRRANSMDDRYLSERAGRTHRRPNFCSFFSAELFHCFWLYLDHKNEIMEKKKFCLGLENTAVKFDIFFPTKAWFKDFCVNMVKYGHILKFHWFCTAPEAYALIIPMSAQGSGSGRALKTDFDMQSAFFTSYIDKFVKHRVVAAKKPAAGALVFRQKRTLTLDDQASLTASTAKIQEVAASQVASAEAEHNFLGYLESLFKWVIMSNHSVDTFKDATMIVEDYITFHNQVPKAFEFYHQVLRYPWLKETFTEVFNPMLGEEWLVGLAALFACRDIQEVPDQDQPSSGIDFFSLEYKQNMNVRGATSQAVNAFAPFKSVDKGVKDRVSSQIEPFMDVYLNSASLEISTDALVRYREKFRESGEITYEKRQLAAFEAGLKGAVKDETSLHHHQSTVLQVLDRFATHYKLQDFIDHDMESWLRQDENLRYNQYPHYGHANLSGMIRFSAGGETIVPSPEAGSSSNFQLSGAVWIEDWLRGTCIPNLPYHPALAAAAFAEKEKSREAETTKAERRKARKEGLSNPIVPDAADASGPESPLPTPKRSKGTPTTPKRPMTAVPAASTGPNLPPLRSGVPPGSSPLAARQTNDGSSGGAKLSLGNNYGDIEDFSKLWKSVDPATTLNISARMHQAFLNAPSLTVAPPAAVDVIASVLDLEQRNAAHHAHATGLAGREVGSHTNATSKARRALINNLLVKCNKGHAVYANKTDLPGQLAYVSLAQQKAADKQVVNANAPQGLPKAGKATGATGTPSKTPKGPRRRATNGSNSTSTSKKSRATGDEDDEE